MPHWYLPSVNFHYSGHRQPSEEMRDEEELTQEVLEIVMVFSRRLYSSRSHRNKELIDHMREATN